MVWAFVEEEAASQEEIENIHGCSKRGHAEGCCDRRGCQGCVMEALGTFKCNMKKLY